MAVETKRVSAKMALAPAPPPRQRKEPTAPLALPEFDSDSDDDDPPDEIEVESNNNAGFQGDFKWDGVGEIQQLKRQNADLIASLKEHKAQIAELQLLLEAVEPVPGLDLDSLRDVLQGSEVVDHDVRNVKIVHQAKKLRQATVAYNKEKARAAAAVAKVTDLERAVEAARELQLKAERALQRLQLQKAESAKPPTPEKDSKKFDELKVKLEAQALELKRTQRALLREVGDDVPLSEILDSNESGKRGRSQQIIMLKAKIKKLERCAAESEGPRGVDRRAEDDLAAAKLERQRQLEKLVEELQGQKETHEKLARKYDAAKARLQVFEKEAAKNKVKIAAFLDKSQTDDQLIDRLQRELDDATSNKRVPGPRARTADSKSPENDELDALRTICKDQKRQLAHQAAMVESFQRDLQAAQSSDRKQSKASLSKDQFGNYQALAIEKERLVELVKSLQQQLQAAKTDLATPAGAHMPSKASAIPQLRSEASRTRLPSPRPVANELEKLKKTLDVKDEEIATWRHAYEAAIADKSSGSQHAHLIADLEQENSELKAECQRLQAMVRAARKREDTKG
ncbi:hypothetical protein ACHHYP_04382 [Achlya hypogyna]|uniref:Uncharacterized protein n=1 Tax=Achlya hypogyna TaxID=1202772 RepID=A0A1V9Z171_ACHHY|nr:hypothetical protein ACHHYP_04382 [Achlya hypogyna]